MKHKIQEEGILVNWQSFEDFKPEVEFRNLDHKFQIAVYFEQNTEQA